MLCAQANLLPTTRTRQRPYHQACRHRVGAPVSHDARRGLAASGRHPVSPAWRGAFCSETDWLCPNLAPKDASVCIAGPLGALAPSIGFGDSITEFNPCPSHSELSFWMCRVVNPCIAWQTRVSRPRGSTVLIVPLICASCPLSTASSLVPLSVEFVSKIPASRLFV